MAKQDFGKLDRLIKKVAETAAGAVNRRAAKSMGQVSLDLAKQGASAGRNPMGRRWKPRKKGGLALRTMTASLSLRVDGVRFVVASGIPWAGFHQRGAKSRLRSGPLRPNEKRSAASKWKLPKRSILPKKSLPKPWREPVYRAAREAFEQQWHRN